MRGLAEGLLLHDGKGLDELALVRFIQAARSQRIELTLLLGNMPAPGGHVFEQFLFKGDALIHGQVRQEGESVLKGCEQLPLGLVFQNALMDRAAMRDAPLDHPRKKMILLFDVVNLVAIFEQNVKERLQSLGLLEAWQLVCFPFEPIERLADQLMFLFQYVNPSFSHESISSRWFKT